MRLKLVFSCLLLSFIYHAQAHKFYISIADMEYDSTDQRINVSLKMTAHDFEYILGLKFKEEIEFGELSDTSEVVNYARFYIRQNFRLYSAEQQCPIVFLGYEITLRDDLFYYFSFTDVKDPTAIKIMNTLLFSISDQQQNIVHYKYKGATKSVTLTPSKSEGEINFDTSP